MPVDCIALARALVLALFPVLAEAIKAGAIPRAAFDAAWEQHGARWYELHGPDVAREAAATLDELMAWNVMTPVGRLEWYSRAPVADLRPDPVEAIPAPPPPDAIGPAGRAWRALWGETG